MPWYTSIRFKITAMVVIPVLAIFLLFTWNTQRLLDRFIVESAASTVEKFAQTLNLALSPYTASEETIAEIQPFISELIGLETGGIVYLALLDEQGQQVARTDLVPNPLPPPDTTLQQLEDRNTLHVSRPILLGLSGIGELRYGISIKSIQDAGERLFLRNLRESLLSLGLVLLLILGLTGLILIRINARLTSLLDSSRRITRGNYELTISDDGNDEISQLSSQMNTMAGSIRERIAELEKNEREIRALNEDLELRGEELTATLENLRSAQESLVQAEKLAGLGSVVAAVAHELNTPVGNALTVSSRLAEKTHRFHDALKEGLRKSVLETYLDDTLTATDIMQRSLERAAELIAGFKHVAVDQTSSKRRKFLLNDVINDLLITLRPGIKHSDVRVQTSIEDGLEMDSYPGPLGQVITNLFNNALVHGFEGRKSGLIAINAERRPAGQVVIRFRDDGRGIPQANLARLFDPFFTTKLGKGGSGLGMHIVYNIVTGVLQGSISVQSEAEQGTEFVMVLPLSPRPVDEPASNKNNANKTRPESS